MGNDKGLRTEQCKEWLRTHGLGQIGASKSERELYERGIARMSDEQVEHMMQRFEQLEEAMKNAPAILAALDELLAAAKE